MAKTRNTGASAKADRAGGLKPRTLFHGFGLAALIPCAMGCAQPPSDSQFEVSDQGDGVFLVTDKRTTCEYIAMQRGGVALRADGYGNVTPNCAASHGYAKDFPYGKRPDQGGANG